MQNTTGLKAIKINSDVDAKYLKPTEAAFILNQSRNMDGLGKTHALFANEKIAEVDKPSGENYCIGSYYAEATNETYSWHWNSLGNYFIRRDAADSTEIIYNGQCLDLDIDPMYAADEFRAYMIFDKGRNGERGIWGKYLVWSFGKRQPNFLDVELSYETDSFNLDVFTNCVKDICDYTNLEFRQPQRCIMSDVDSSSIDLDKSNNCADKPWQWRYQYVGYDGRTSEWSPISSMNWIDHPACIKDTAAFPRCFLLDIPAGDAFVEKINIAFRNDNNNQWYKCDTVHKYGAYTTAYQKWYERDIVLNQYDADACMFTYQFCADKSCDPIAPEDTVRISNEMPNTAQGIVPIDNRLAFYNPVRGNDPLPLAEKEKISFSTEVDEGDCELKTVKIKVALIIHAEYHQTNQFIYQMEDGDTNGEEVTHQLRYGGLMPVLNGGFENAANYGQTFDGDSKNFKVYVEGTEYWTELKQVFVTNYTDYQDYARVTNMDKDSVARDQRRKIKDDEYYMSIGELIVPKGTQGFIRVMGQHAQGLEPSTSTTVKYIVADRRDYHADRSGDTIPKIYKKELFFSACTEEAEIDLTDTPFLVSDLAVDRRDSAAGSIGSLLTNGAFGLDGYIKDVNGAPIEYARIEVYDYDIISGGIAGFWLLADTEYTDHNGYYFLTTKARAKVDISIETSPSGFEVAQTIPKGAFSRGKTVHNDYTVGGDAYASDYTNIVMLQIKDCNGSPIPGITMAVEGSKASEADLNGIVRVAMRNNYTRNRSARAIVMQSSVCLFKTCDGECNPCMDLFLVETSGSYSGNPIDDLGTVTYKVFGNTSRFLKHGGRYEFGLTMIGNGRTSYIQSNEWFVDIPTVQALGSHAKVTVRVTYSSAVNWPDWVEHVSFSRSKNLNFDDYLQWVVDDIEYVDRDGNPANQLAASNLRLTIQSLNDYNEKYFFKTNTKYQYTQGDRLEFITNGDGEIYYAVINTLVLSPFATEQAEDDTKERPEGWFNQLLISNDESLEGLVKGAVIEIQKPKICETEARFQEICSPIPVQYIPTTFTLDTFDTYLLARQIPNQTINFTFEHHSITDFWGDHVDDQGRLNARNEFEREQRLGRYMMVTDSWSEFGTGIGVNKFRTEQIKQFQGVEQGDIIAMHIWDAKILMAICQHDNFNSIVGDDFLRVGQDGIVKVTPTDQIVSNPQAKIAGRYGCGYDEVGSVYFGSGFVTWTDAINGCYVAASESSPRDVSHHQISSFFEPRVKAIMAFNIDKTGVEKIRYCTGYDPDNKYVMLTMKAPRMAGVNNAHNFNGMNKTICYDPKAMDFPTTAAFTPEAYGKIGTYLDKANTFLSFFKSDTFAHYLRSDKFNTFYGVGTDRVLTICANENPSKEKRFLSIEIQSDRMWFVESVLVDNGAFVSEIPPVRVKHKMNKWNAEFLRDINSRGGLYNGKQCEGYHALMTLVRDNTNEIDGKPVYKSVNRTKMGLQDDTDFVFVKYVFVESSGLTQK